MHPIFLSIGSFQIHWYGVMAALAALTAYYVIMANRKFADLTKDQVATLVFYCALVGGTLGARVFFVALNWQHFIKQSWVEMLRIDKGGLVFYGGFFLAILLIVWYVRKHKLSLTAVFDVMVPGLAAGHGIARIGCFLQGCCYGGVTTCFLGVKYPLSANIYPGQAVMPVQLLESAGNLILAGILFYLVRKCRRGVAFSAYIAIYGAMRFGLEMLRGDAERGAFFGWSPAQLIGMIMIPTGVFLVIFFARKPEKSAEKA